MCEFFFDFIDMSHGLTNQEFPTVYVSWGQNGNPDLPVFLSGNGTQIGTLPPPSLPLFFFYNKYNYKKDPKKYTAVYIPTTELIPIDDPFVLFFVLTFIKKST